MDSFFLGGGGVSFLFVSGSGDGDDDLPGEGIGGCTFQMLVYCRSLVGVACNFFFKKKEKAVLAARVMVFMMY